MRYILNKEACDLDMEDSFIVISFLTITIISVNFLKLA
jgi:hypothetical protein